MSRLDVKEQEGVRLALRALWLRAGGWAPVAGALCYTLDAVEKVMNGRRGVSLRLAYRVAEVAGLPIEDGVAGRFKPSGRCPLCGRGSDFGDEDTVVEDVPRPTTGGGLKLVR